MDLDDLTKIKTIDASNMAKTLHEFPTQITKALDIVDQIQLPSLYNIKQIIVSGVGGSAIVGDILQYYLRKKLSIPVFINRLSDLPKWANKHTLVLSISYSGNTEETIQAFKDAIQKHCMIIAITSGGKMKEYCENRGITILSLPTGFEPRAALGYLFFYLFRSLQNLKIIQHKVHDEIDETIHLVHDLSQKYHFNVSLSENPAKKLANTINGYIPQLYGWSIYTPVIKRWANQFNENSKLISQYDELTECNHNDIVGWAENPAVAKTFAVLVFRDAKLESLQLKTRFAFMKKLYGVNAGRYIEIDAQGRSTLAKMISSMYLGDFTSYYLAILREIDPTPISIINALKQELSKI